MNCHFFTVDVISRILGPNFPMLSLKPVPNSFSHLHNYSSSIPLNIMMAAARSSPLHCMTNFVWYPDQAYLHIWRNVSIHCLPWFFIQCDVNIPLLCSLLTFLLLNFTCWMCWWTKTRAAIHNSFYCLRRRLNQWVYLVFYFSM